MTQQYTCPKCHKNYTRFTIAEHYECGVELLEDMSVKIISPEETHALCEKRADVIEQGLVNIAPIPVREVYPNLSAEKPDGVFPDPLIPAEIPAPKKRGRKPKAK